MAILKKIFVFFVLIIYVFSFALITYAENLNDVKNKKQTVDNKLDTLQEQKKREQTTLKSAAVTKRKLNDAAKLFGLEKKKLEVQKSKYDSDLLTIEDTVSEATAKYGDSLEKFKTRVRSMYKSSNRSVVVVLLNSQNIIDMFSKYNLIKNIAKRDKELIDEYKIAKKDLEYKKTLKQIEVAKVQSKIEQNGDAAKKIALNLQATELKIKESNNKLKNIELEEEQMLEESARLSVKIMMSKSKRSFVGGTMMWPCPSSVNITSEFGLRFHPVLKYNRMHTGIDIGASWGSSIVASNDGVVESAGWEGGYGNAVIIDHGGGITTLYGHCTSLLVREGQTVKMAQTIARVGSTGISTGPHLHFEVRFNGEPVDPMNYLGK